MSLTTERTPHAGNIGNTETRDGGAEGHLSIELLGAYHQGKLSEAEEDSIQEHFIACSHCRETMLELADFLDGVSRPGRWRSADLVSEWRKMHGALVREGVPSGRATEALATARVSRRR